MIFDELYSTYYDIAARALQKLTSQDNISKKDLIDLISTYSELEDDGYICKKLLGGSWNLIDRNNKTSIRNFPIQPLTTLERRWLKTLLNDPRIKLFDIAADGLEDVEPLWTEDDYRIFDTTGTPDPWEDQNYINHFKCILHAIRSELDLEVEWTSREGYTCVSMCRPELLEYALLDDKFRLLARAGDKEITINVARITRCRACQTDVYWIEFPVDVNAELPEANTRLISQNQRQLAAQTDCEFVDDNMVSFVIHDIDNAYERVLLDFAVFQKQDIQKLNNKRYKCTLCYDPADFNELIIRLLAYGPKVQVLSPKLVVDKIVEHVKHQAELFRLSSFK